MQQIDISAKSPSQIKKESENDLETSRLPEKMWKTFRFISYILFRWRTAINFESESSSAPVSHSRRAVPTGSTATPPQGHLPAGH